LDGPSDIYTLTGADLERLVTQHRPRLVYIANPNNPTGWLLGNQELGDVAAGHHDTMFIVDEAYGEYSGESAIPLATSRPNIVVARTFSKAYGLAGMRIGYLVATPGNVGWLNLIRNGKNVSMIGQVAAVAALKDQVYLQSALARLREGLAVLVEGLSRLGIEHRDTPANFVLIKVKDAPLVQRELSKLHIYIRSMSHLKGMNGYLRITLGDAPQMKRLIGSLEQILNGASC
jgi:histidinol-phosphate aminotransferase